MAPGHMIPMVDTAKLFDSHGACATMVTTSANALVQPAIDSFNLHSGRHQHQIALELILRLGLASPTAAKT